MDASNVSTKVYILHFHVSLIGLQVHTIILEDFWCVNKVLKPPYSDATILSNNVILFVKP